MLDLDAPAASPCHVAAKSEAPPDWYRDPTGRSELRYWDGRTWTERVMTEGRQGIDPPTMPPPGPVSIDLAALGTAQGFVVHQRPKLSDLTLEYDVFDRDGRVDRRVIAEAGEVPKDRGRKIRRSLGLDYGQGYELEIRDGQGRVLLRLDLKPVRLSEGFGSRYAGVVSRPDGSAVGRIVSAKKWSDTQFALQVDGEAMGTLDTVRMPGLEFSMTDNTGVEFARMERKRSWVADDSYVVEINRPVPNPVRCLIVAAPFMIDLLVERYQKRFRRYHR